MKKKFLSLMMAAAVVATTSVSAFALEGNTTVAEDNDTTVVTPTQSNINSLDSSDHLHEVTITGKVQSDEGKMPATSFKVTVPTAANFTVNNSGTVVGPTLTVKNEGTQAIKVFAQDFRNTGKGRIKVLGADVIERDKGTLDRRNMSLNLLAENGKVAYLSAADGKNGVSTDPNLGQIAKEVELLDLTAAENGVAVEKRFTLHGTAGTAEGVTSPISDTFKLTLKIKKA